MSEQVKQNPTFDPVNSSICRSWAKTIPQNAHGKSRTVADFPERINAAIHVALHGPMLACHRTNNAVMWDLPAYTGFEVAMESALLLQDLTASILTLLTAEQIDALNLNSFSRRSVYLANNRKPISVEGGDFYDENLVCKWVGGSEITLKQGPGEAVDFRFDPRTGKLLLVSIPVNCGPVAFLRAVESEIEIFQSDRNALALNCSYKDAVFAMLLTSLADLKVLLKSDVVDAYFEACSGGANEQI
jgi:hypothetical protein